MASKLFDSRLSSSHHYYIVLFEAKEISSIDEIYKIFSVKKNKEDFDLSIPGLSFTHFQLEIPGAFGSPLVLAGNKTREIDGMPNYWYDFYMGSLSIEQRQFFFISYPYVRLGKYIESCLSSNHMKRILYKPAIADVMEFMKTHDGNYVFKKENLKIEISKYTAKILEDKTNKINISGGNPLNSEVFRILNNADSIQIETTSLRMSCYIPNRGGIDLSFDKLGNYRFWIPYQKEVAAFSTVPSIFRFFNKEKLLVKDSYFNSYTLLEDEKD